MEFVVARSISIVTMDIVAASSNALPLVLAAVVLLDAVMVLSAITSSLQPVVAGLHLRVVFVSRATHSLS